MSVNKFKPYVYILPEDEANRQLANGFDQCLNTRQLQVLTEARGWIDACEIFKSDYIDKMRENDYGFIILLIDFDNKPDRPKQVQSYIPIDLADRVFVLGVKTEPEALKKACLASYETIGEMMADDCRNGTQNIWGHELLSHNEEELRRLRQTVYDILF